MKEQDLASREREVEIWPLRDDANESLHFYLLCPNVVVADPRLAARWPHASCKNPDCRRLAGAVWTKQAKDFPAAHVERQSIQRDDLSRRLVLFTTWAKPTCGKRRWRCVNFSEVACANAS